MQRISAYKRRAGIIAMIVMSSYFVSGLRLFCADDFLLPLRSFASNAATAVATASGAEDTEVSAHASVSFDATGGTSPCSCKKKKKCPAIPRTVITSNPTHRLSEFQRLAKSECCDSLVPQVTGHHFFTRGNTPLLELASHAAFYSSTPFALTCVLLI
jgi:hypothetical protein